MAQPGSSGGAQPGLVWRSRIDDIDTAEKFAENGPIDDFPARAGARKMTSSQEAATAARMLQEVTDSTLSSVSGMLMFTSVIYFIFFASLTATCFFSRANFFQSRPELASGLELTPGR